MADHLATAAGVVVDAPVGGLDRQPARRRPGDDRVEAPAFVIDLDDVARLDALEPHWMSNSSRNAGATRTAGAGGLAGPACDAPPVG